MTGRTQQSAQNCARNRERHIIKYLIKSSKCPVKYTGIEKVQANSGTPSLSLGTVVKNEDKTEECFGPRLSRRDTRTAQFVEEETVLSASAELPISMCSSQDRAAKNNQLFHRYYYVMHMQRFITTRKPDKMATELSDFRIQ